MFAKEIKTVEEECIPLKEKVVHHKNWFDQNRKDVIELIETRRRIKLQVGRGEEFKAIQRRIQRECRRMKKEFLEKTSKKIQEYADKNMSREFYDAIKKEYGIFGKKGGGGLPDQVLNADGETLTEGKDEKNERIFGHFNKLLNQQIEVGENIEDYLPIRREIFQKKKYF